jgi:hypothetical protein
MTAETIAKALDGQKVSGDWAASCAAREKREGRAE